MFVFLFRVLIRTAWQADKYRMLDYGVIPKLVGSIPLWSGTFFNLLGA